MRSKEGAAMSATMIEPRRYCFTREQYYQMLELGWFQDQRVELIEGEIVVAPPQKNLHALALSLTEDALRLVFDASAYWARGQMTLDLSGLSAVDPDVAVVAGAKRSHSMGSNPATALLVVEVSDTSLSYDRGRKASLYAAAGIQDYWIVNVVHTQLEVYRDIVADSAQPFGFRYAQRTVLSRADSIAPLAAPRASIAVADLFP